jgi:hypothetical protein
MKEEAIMVSAIDGLWLVQVYFMSALGCLVVGALVAVIVEDITIAAELMGAVLLSAAFPIVNTAIAIMGVVIGMAYGLCLLMGLLSGKEEENE